jgi:hypothetical protein
MMLPVIILNLYFVQVLVAFRSCFNLANWLEKWRAFGVKNVIMGDFWPVNVITNFGAFCDVFLYNPLCKSLS